MKHTKYKLSLALLLATIVQASAQMPQRLTLSEAVRLSLQNSKQLKLSHAKVDEAVAHTREMWDNHLPDIKASGSYLRLNSPDVTLKVKLGPSSGGSGGGVEVNQAAYALVNGSLPLFAGFRIKYGVESARYLEQAVKLDAEQDKGDVIQNTINAYSNLYKAQKMVDLVKENLHREEARVKDFQNLETNGLMARNDLLKATLQKSNVELSLLDAENNLRVATANMNLMLGLPEEAPVVTDSNSFTVTTDSLNLLRWEQLAFEKRKDMSALTYREKAATTGIKAAKGEYYPNLALTGGLIAADIPNVLTISNALNAGLGLQYNLGTLWKTGAKVHQAKARLAQVQATEDIMADQVRLQVNQAYNNYMLSIRKISVYRQAIEQAEENYRITKNKYDNNLATTTELLDADVAQLQASLNYAFSQADAVVSFNKLKQTAGIIAE